MDFNLPSRNGDVIHGTTERESSSLFHDAFSHMKDTWSNVLSGKGTVAEYAEVAAEATVGIAAGALLFRQGAKLFATQSRVAAADAEKLAQIKMAARGDIDGLAKFKANPRGIGLPGFTVENEQLAAIRKASRAGLDLGAGRGKFPLDPTRLPILSAKDLNLGVPNHELAHDLAGLTPKIKFMQPRAGLPNSVADPDLLTRIRYAAKADLAGKKTVISDGLKGAATPGISADTALKGKFLADIKPTPRLRITFR